MLRGDLGPIFTESEIVDLSDRFLRKLYELTTGTASPSPTALWDIVGGEPTSALKFAVQDYLEAHGLARFDVVLLPAGERRAKGG